MSLIYSLYKKYYYYIQSDCSESRNVIKLN